MTIRLVFLIILASMSSVVFAIQPAVIDLNAKPDPFSQSDYDAMLACTLEKHPDETRRYAEYHLVRRNNQTWQENEKDPDSDLMMPIIESCYEIEMGKPFPFSLDKLIFDWSEAHSTFAENPKSKPMKVGNAADLAACAVQNHRDIANQIAKMSHPIDALRHIGKIIGPQCQTIDGFKLNINDFQNEVIRLLAQGENAAQEAQN